MGVNGRATVHVGVLASDAKIDVLMCCCSVCDLHV